MAQFLYVWSLLRTSLWFVPAVMSLAALGLAVLALNYGDRLLMNGMTEAWWLYSGKPEDARQLLATLLSSMINIAALVVSITMVVLALTVNQLGPRIIRNFMGNLRTQLAIGSFVMAIVYLVVVLRTFSIHAGMDPVPHLAVTLGTALSLANLFVLLFFVHYLARSVVSDTVVHRVGKELGQAIARLLPVDGDGRPAEEPAAQALPAGFAERAAVIALPRSGYIQTIAHDRLVDLARQHQVVLHLMVQAGQFILPGGAHLRVSPGDRLDAALQAAICGAITVGSERTPAQDLEYSIRHLVEIALRALSPSINDPFTAIAVIDQLGAALATLLTRQLQPQAFRDEEGAVRVVAPAPGYGALIDIAFHQIRRAGADKPEVMISLLETITHLAARVRLPSQRDALARHARLVADAGCGAATVPADRAEIDRSFRSACEALGDGSRRHD